MVGEFAEWWKGLGKDLEKDVKVLKKRRNK